MQDASRLARVVATKSATGWVAQRSPECHGRRLDVRRDLHGGRLKVAAGDPSGRAQRSWPVTTFGRNQICDQMGRAKVATFAEVT